MSKLTILLVDDNFGDQLLVRKALEASNRGTLLQVASDGDEAHSFLWKEGKYRDAPTPDLIMLDLNVPRKNGRELLAEIRKEPALRDIPVVLVTGAKPTKEMTAICELNPNFYFVKPDGVEAFFAIVRGIEEYGLNMVALPKGGKDHAKTLRELTAA